jgi:hypothetical protein
VVRARKQLALRTTPRGAEVLKGHGFDRLRKKSVGYRSLHETFHWDCW